MWYSWDPSEHSDQENLQWSWLRAVEWGLWPIFMSQPIAPIAFIYYSWWKVILVIAVLNLGWSIFIRYKIVIPSLAQFGVFFVRLKWISIPISTYILWKNGKTGTAMLALFWPVLNALVPHTPSQIGVIQKMFMETLGYEAKKTSGEV